MAESVLPLSLLRFQHFLIVVSVVNLELVLQMVKVYLMGLRDKLQERARDRISLIKWHFECFWLLHDLEGVFPELFVLILKHLVEWVVGVHLFPWKYIRWPHELRVPIWRTQFIIEHESLVVQISTIVQKATSPSSELCLHYPTTSTWIIAAVLFALGSLNRLDLIILLKLVEESLDILVRGWLGVMLTVNLLDLLCNICGERLN